MMPEPWSILVVEDSVAYCDIIEFMLPEGCRIEWAHGAAAALECLGRDKWDLALVDIRLKDDDAGNLDGLRVIQEGLVLSPQTRFVATSAYAEHDVRLEALTRGALRFIAKPFRPEELRGILDEVMG
jgi:CheY-like chemotaxis protein